eukprot:CAMPEP_0113670798 /NCGR_PEP_ID=MMETSP0038_2-20120614/5344_1 /TAXON_ID=2898 /ORGANISM="Cryptomonas paramecium" /LENGTH=146 /DNA_ID=CAMNT_0000586869 /DNA_START=6 /DNA_END=446 /DNA_ORIENTATION=+ /assembly_acc=CAM_ASM_000170
MPTPIYPEAQDFQYALANLEERTKPGQVFASPPAVLPSAHSTPQHQGSAPPPAPLQFTPLHQAPPMMPSVSAAPPQQLAPAPKLPGPDPNGFDAVENTPLTPALCARLGVPVGTLWGPPAHQHFTHEGQTYPFKDVKAIFDTFSHT